MRNARQLARLPLTAIVLIVASIGAAYAQPDSSDTRDAFDSPPSAQAAWYPDIRHEVHRNGCLWTVINNNGIVGNIYGYRLTDLYKTAPTFYYPRYSRIQHGYYTGLWVGGILGTDTLVSTSIDDIGNREFWPDYYPFGEFEVVTSNSDASTQPYWSANEVEYSAVFTDTFEEQDFVSYNNYDNRKHQSLGLQVRQTSYSWTYKYAEDFIIVDYVIQNVGEDTIKSAWAGIYYNGCVYHRGEVPLPVPDDQEGYIYSRPHDFEELGNELLRIAYCLDKDGYAGWYGWDFVRTPHVFGIAPLRTPTGAFTNNFNWWTDQSGSRLTWGPRMQPAGFETLRYFFGGLGAPLGDNNRYYLMSKPEIDYSGFEAAVDHTEEGWMPRVVAGPNIARGHEVEFVTSFGPFDLPPARAETLTVVMAVGADVHTDPEAYQKLFGTYQPQPFMDQLDFSDLITNVRWAKMIYDNPGVDTDGDGDSGKWFMRYNPTTLETLRVFYEGDGVPDFRGASPPPPPSVRILTDEGKIVIRWNGHFTENFVDPMTASKDFEGYRVYISRSEREEEAMLLASWDVENYNRYKWDALTEKYVIKEIPFTLDSLRVLYGETFNPLDYSYSYPFFFDGDYYYFKESDFNASDYTDPTQIHKRFPNAPLDTSDVTDEGYVRYYEWEYTIEDLLPTVTYYVSVTAFDFGHPGRSLDPLESPVSANWTEVVPISRGDDQVLQDGALDVYVYPNPYRVDDKYYVHGFENRLDETGHERARSIFFANLPYRCTISIYSLDGDLVRRLEHDEPTTSGTASIERWDVISRNTESVVSGLYYWVVESSYGTQIGKLAILK